MTSLDGVRAHLPELPGLGGLPELIGKDPDVAEEFDVE